MEAYVNNIDVDVIVYLLDMLQNNVCTGVITNQLSNVLINAAKSTFQCKNVTNNNNGNNGKPWLISSVGRLGRNTIGPKLDTKCLEQTKVLFY